eukprot:jgi/Botrbrau1/3384/Bobra.0337s0025.1
MQDTPSPEYFTLTRVSKKTPGEAAARAAQDKQTLYAVMLTRQQPPVAFQPSLLIHLEGCMLMRLALLQRLQGLWNQAIIAQEDVEGYSLCLG